MAGLGVYMYYVLASVVVGLESRLFFFTFHSFSANILALELRH